MSVAFRRHILPPLDDCLYALQAASPHLTRSALHRCFPCHGISRLPDIEGDKPKRQRFKRFYAVSHLTNMSAKSGFQIQNNSSSIQSIETKD